MFKIHNKHYEINGILKIKTESVQQVLKYTILISVEKIYKMQHLEGSGTPVLYIGCTVLKG
jgi:hypothetical protein